MKEVVYDVIIVGAGPAGLSVGSELSKKHKILVIDRKSKISDTTKSWYLPRFSYKSSPELKKFMYGDVKRFMINTFTGENAKWKAKLSSRYSFIKEHEILDFWGNRIIKNNSNVIMKCSYKNHNIRAGIIRVKTSRGTFSGKLLIDASGVNSPIRKRDEKPLYWSMFGHITKHKKMKGMKPGDYMLWQTFEDTNTRKNTSLSQGRLVLEYEILNKNTSFPFIFYLRKKRVPVSIMKKQFLDIIKKEKSTSNFRNIELGEIKYGWYPSGGLSQKIAENKIAFIGDAGCWTTPCGWGMSFILNNYKKYSKHLGEAIAKDLLSKDGLMNLIELKVHEKHQILFNQIMAHFLAYADTAQLDKFIKFFSSLDFLICEKLITLTIKREELRGVLIAFFKNFNLLELIKVFPKKDYPIILKDLGLFVEDAIVDEINSLLDGIQGKKPKKGLRQGYDFN